MSVAALLVALSIELLTETLNCAPLSEVVVAGVPYEDEVAPVMAVPFLLHW